jgi:hypothetical protein
MNFQSLSDLFNKREASSSGSWTIFAFIAGESEDGSINAEGWLLNLDERTFLGMCYSKKKTSSLQIDRLERLNELTMTYSAQREQGIDSIDLLNKMV